MTVSPKAMNLDEDGNRVSDPVIYGSFLKTRFAGGKAGIHWTSEPSPEHILRAIEEQLRIALDCVRRQLASYT